MNNRTRKEICLADPSLLITLDPGKKFHRALTITEDLMGSFASLSTDRSRIHIDEDFAKKHGFFGRVAYGNILGMLVSALVGMDLGSQKVMIISQLINFKRPVYINDTVELVATLSTKSEAVGVAEFKLHFTNDTGVQVANGSVQVKCL